MKMSQLFTRTRKENPSDEEARNAQLLIRAGYIYKEAAGVYAYLPVGYRVLQNIIQVIRDEMNSVGGQELSMTALQNKSVWESTGRWSDEAVEVWFKTQLKSGGEMGLAFTHEEPITHLMTNYVSSYRDLPFSAYQFQTKFRNETRAKSGIMRCREFIMKDLYSFSKDQAEHDAFYEEARKAYIRVFNRLGLGAKTLYTFASGGSFSQFSHEFQTITDAGEDIVYYDPEIGMAINEEIYNDETIAAIGADKSRMVQYKTCESGNIFSLGTKFSNAYNLTYRDEEGNNKPVIMGSYGIGPGRAMGIIAETLSDDRGLVWPRAIAPFVVHIVALGQDKEEVLDALTIMTDALKLQGVTYIVDDRPDTTAGAKLADSDLMGMPYRIVVSPKSLLAGGFACKERTELEEKIMTLEEVIVWLE